MTVGELKAKLKDIPDDSEVLIDTEARRYNYHLVSLNYANFERLSEFGMNDMFILSPDYSDTEL